MLVLTNLLFCLNYNGIATTKIWSISWDLLISKGFYINIFYTVNMHILLYTQFFPPRRIWVRLGHNRFPVPPSAKANTVLDVVRVQSCCVSSKIALDKISTKKERTQNIIIHFFSTLEWLSHTVWNFKKNLKCLIWYNQH